MSTPDSGSPLVTIGRRTPTPRVGVGPAVGCGDTRSGHTTLVLRLTLAFLATLGCVAAVPGDVGGCGQPVEELDPELFYLNRRETDCEKCQQCGLVTQTCWRACDERTSIQTSFPPGCVPLVHDGEVCLNALDAASCRAYADYVSDVAPRVPTECDFCPLREAE